MSSSAVNYAGRHSVATRVASGARPPRDYTEELFAGEVVYK